VQERKSAVEKTSPEPYLGTLSARENEILGLIGEGLSNAAIAQQLFLSLETIKWYNKQIFSKLGVNSRTQALLKVRKDGLLDLPNAAPKHNLPRQITRFIGRETQVHQVKAFLQESPLVTLTGSGGVGKSRLSIQVAGEVLGNYADGVWFVELAPIMNPSLLPQAIARTLGLVEEAERSINEVLTAYLRQKHVLLVLDNCEHLLDACARLVDGLLSNCPRLSLLVTSREALGLPGETVYRLSSLQVPDLQQSIHIGEFQSIEAVQLFIERARDVLPTFEVTEGNRVAITEICQRLDGIPLAIELAAARMNVLTTEQLANRLDNAFSVLHGRRPAALPRHQTLRAAIEWTYDLLSEEERHLLRSLSVFLDGWTLEAAEAVCKDEGLGLASLVNKSIVVAVRAQGQETRYHLLETIRQYAWEKLAEAGETELLRDRHLAYFVRWAEETNPKLLMREQRAALSRLKAEHENLHAALHWALEVAEPARAEDGLRLACALSNYWNRISAYRVGFSWLEKVLSITVAGSAPWEIYRATALLKAALFRYSPPYPPPIILDTLRVWTNESISIFRKYGDLASESQALVMLGEWISVKDYASASMVFEDAIRTARQSGDRGSLGSILYLVGMRTNEKHDWVKARALLEESLALFSEVEDQWSRTATLAVLSEVATLQGDLPTGSAYLKEVIQNLLKEFEEIDIQFSSYLVQTAYYLGDYSLMEILMEISVEKARKVGNDLTLIYYQRIAGVIARGRGDLQRAAKVFKGSLLSAQRFDDEYGVYAAIGRLAGVALDSGQLELGARLLAAVEVFFEASSMHALGMFDQDQFEDDADKARQQLGETAFLNAWSSGHLIPLEEAIREAQAIGAEWHSIRDSGGPITSA
jgi:predicted ATPase/DNA-binding CsgD family transcriptional regulator